MIRDFPSKHDECDEVIANLRRRLTEAQARLGEYVGWAPDQFLRYQEEHRKLQAQYVELDARWHLAQARIEKLESLLRQQIAPAAIDKLAEVGGPTLTYDEAFRKCEILCGVLIFIRDVALAALDKEASDARSVE